MSSGRARPKRFFSSCTTTALSDRRGERSRAPPRVDGSISSTHGDADRHDEDADDPAAEVVHEEARRRRRPAPARLEDVLGPLLVELERQRRPIAHDRCRAAPMHAAARHEWRRAGHQCAGVARAGRSVARSSSCSAARRCRHSRRRLLVRRPSALPRLGGSAAARAPEPVLRPHDAVTSGGRSGRPAARAPRSCTAPIGRTRSARRARRRSGEMRPGEPEVQRAEQRRGGSGLLRRGARGRAPARRGTRTRTRGCRSRAGSRCPRSRRPTSRAP